MTIDIPNQALKKIGIVLASVVVLAGAAVAGATLTHKNTPHSNQQDINQTSNQPSNNSQVESSNTTSPASTTTPQPVPQTNTSVVDAKLCKSTLDSALALGNSYNQMYSDSWKNWLNTYKDDLSSQAALDAKQYDKTYIQNLYANLITNTDQQLQNMNCGYSSVAESLIQPNYDLW